MRKLLFAMSAMTTAFAVSAATVNFTGASGGAYGDAANWTAEGGGLLVVPGERADPGFYTNWTWRTKPVMPARWTGFERTPAGEKPPTLDDAPVAGRMAFDDQYLVSDGPVNARTNEPYGKTTKSYSDWLAAQTKEVLSCM